MIAAGDAFTLTAAILAVAAAIGFIANRARQPLVVAFIAVGIIVGPSVLDWVSDTEPIELFAEIGIAVLLFLVGLKLDLHLVRTTGRVALITGLGQVAFTSLIGFGLAIVLGMSATVALYVAVALTFSSTIIIVKLLSDKRELDELHGRIALGFLIVQDIVVVLVMIVLATIGNERDGSVAVQIGLVAAQGAGLIVAMAIVIRWVLPRLLDLVASSQELLIVSAVAWAVSVAAFSDWLGFSVEVGAFLAGFAVASTPYRESIAASLTGLRDFLLLFFFIELGAQLDFSAIGSQVPAAIVLSLFVLIGNPMIVLVIMGVMRYPKRVSFLAGLAVAQISEFSLILITLGRELGHVDNDAVGLVTLVGMITIAMSTYLILYSHQIFERLSGALSIFERRGVVDVPTHQPERVDVIVYGYGRFGRRLVEHLARNGHHVLVVDWDPHTRIRPEEEALAERITKRFGDADDPEFPSSLPIDSARWIVSTIPRVDTNKVLANSLQRWGASAKLAVTAHTASDVQRLAPEIDSGSIDLVLQPFDAAADAAIAGFMDS
ncbi:MAG: cation:proton antiporter [Ilumatobacter sp.]|jgi:Kef-type K+ transport system membrane component KefB|uniref:cation:proton antiporter n=1 Tax=Ilumatobacter sp. TaxID=1967498 RepID=UPI00391CCB61